MRHVIDHLGVRYNVRHIFELARFFLPVSLVPRRWRRAALTFGTSPSGRAAICSTMIAEAFERVGYPILPEVVLIDAVAPGPRWRRWLGYHDGPAGGALPARQYRGDHAARLRSVSVLRGGEVQPPRRSALRLSPDRLGGRTARPQRKWGGGAVAGGRAAAPFPAPAARFPQSLERELITSSRRRAASGRDRAAASREASSGCTASP